MLGMEELQREKVSVKECGKRGKSQNKRGHCNPERVQRVQTD